MLKRVHIVTITFFMSLGFCMAARNRLFACVKPRRSVSRRILLDSTTSCDSAASVRRRGLLQAVRSVLVDIIVLIL
jgi:hypothetical protein